MYTKLKLLKFKDALFCVHEEYLPISYNAKRYGEKGIKSQYFSTPANSQENLFYILLEVHMSFTGYKLCFADTYTTKIKLTKIVSSVFSI